MSGTDTRPYLRTSASQFATFRRCKRNWWLEHVVKLTVPQRVSQTFGSVLHQVCDRYLSADDLGRDERGQPVELFPVDWHLARDRFHPEKIEGEATVMEQDMIKQLIATAISQGVLERRPGRQVEKRFQQRMYDGPEGRVDATGFVDVSYPAMVEDHKTSKSTKWLKQAKPTSPNYLGDDPQMLLYAIATCNEGDVTFRHNQYVKDPNNLLVRKTEVVVPAKRIYAEYDRFQEDCQGMLRLAATASTWSDCPDPLPQDNPCQAFGGCPFIRICAGQETEAGYRSRFIQATVNQTYNAPTGQESPMSTIASMFASRVRAGAPQAPAQPTQPTQPAPLQAPVLQTQPAQPAQPAQPTPPPPPTQPVQGPPPVAAQGIDAWKQAFVMAVDPQSGHYQLTVPPWHVQGCKACGETPHPGFNTKGSPCRACDSQAPGVGLPTSKMFTIQPQANGTAYWVFNDDPAKISGLSPLPNVGAPEVEAQAKTDLTQGQPSVQEQEPSPTTDSAPLPIEPDATEVAKGPKGRPPKGFTLVANAACVKGEERRNSGRGIHHLEDVLQRIHAQMLDQAKQAGIVGKTGQVVESVMDLDTFSRWDTIAKYAETLAPEFKTDYVVVNMLGTARCDLKVLFDSLRPFAGMVWIGTGGAVG